MNREDIYEIIEEIVDDNDGAVEDGTQLLVHTGIDSFGVAMVLLELDNTFKCFSKEYETGIDLSNYSINDMIDRVEECS